MLADDETKIASGASAVCGVSARGRPFWHSLFSVHESLASHVESRLVKCASIVLLRGIAGRSFVRWRITCGSIVMCKTACSLASGM